MQYRIIDAYNESNNGKWQNLNDPTLVAQIVPKLDKNGFVRVFPRNGDLHNVQNPLGNNNILVQGANISSISQTQVFAIDFRVGSFDPCYTRIPI